FTFLAKLGGWLDVERMLLAFHLNAITFAVTGLIIWSLPIRSNRRRDRVDAGESRFDAAGAWGALREGWAFIFLNPVVRAVHVGLATGLIGGGMLIPLGSIFAEDVLGAGEAGYGSLVTALGTGVAFGVLGVTALQ